MNFKLKKRLKSYLYGSLNDFSYEDGLTVIRTTKIIETNKMINSEANLTENSQKLVNMFCFVC